VAGRPGLRRRGSILLLSTGAGVRLLGGVVGALALQGRGARAGRPGRALLDSRARRDEAAADVALQTALRRRARRALTRRHGAPTSLITTRWRWRPPAAGAAPPSYSRRAAGGPELALAKLSAERCRRAVARYWRGRRPPQRSASWPSPRRRPPPPAPPQQQRPLRRCGGGGGGRR